MKLHPQHYISHISHNLHTLSSSLHRLKSVFETIRVRVHLLGYTELHACYLRGQAPEDIKIAPEKPWEMYEGLRWTQDMLATVSSDLHACCNSFNEVRGVLDALLIPRRSWGNTEVCDEEGGISWPGLDDSIVDHERILRNQGMKYEGHLKLMAIRREVMETGGATEDEVKLAKELCTEFMGLAQRYLWSVKNFRAWCQVVADVTIWLRYVER
ncbi:hypothetical protein DFP73DRAFT_598285 [Morchella snyderi]|nr:hypothetical protein DFP73DRAFT_598285 [Morchella snyderi]